MCGAESKDQTYFGRRLDSRQGLFPKRKGGISLSIFRCRSCGLLYPNPMPIPGNIGEHYDVAPEEYWPESYLKIEPNILAGEIQTFRMIAGREPEECCALDVGAGIGKGMRALENAGFEVFGIEPSNSFRKAAISRMKIQEDRLQLAAIETAKFEDHTFDFINFGAILEHVADPASALTKAMPWLKPSGLIYVEVPSSAFLLSRLVRLFYRLTLAGDFVINTCPMHPPYHLYEFSLRSFQRHGIRSGYRIAHHSFSPCASYMPKILIRPFNAVMKWTKTGMQLGVWLQKT